MPEAAIDVIVKMLLSADAVTRIDADEMRG